MRRLLLLSLLLGAALLRAEVPVTTFTFANPEKTDLGTNWSGQEGWTNAFEKPCKARTNGIGIAPRTTKNGQSGMKYVWDAGNSETIAQITVICMTGGTSAATASKIHTLGVTVNGTLMTESFSFGGAVDTPVTLTFNLDTPTAVQSIQITNETDQSGNDYLFEINTVSWQAAFPGIEATFIAPRQASICSTLFISLSTLTGGSGVYTEKYFTFNGETIHVEGTEVVTFTAPEQDGTWPLTLTVTDSAGETAVFTQDIEIVFIVTPTNLQASEITRNGFTLSWDQPFSSAVTGYLAEVRPAQTDILTDLLTPAWKNTDGVWELEMPINLRHLAKGVPLKTLSLIAKTPWTGTLRCAYDTAPEWRNTTRLSRKEYILGSVPTSATYLHLIADAETPPAGFTLSLNLGVIASRELEASGSAHTVTFTDLPSGCSVSAIVKAATLYNDGSLRYFGSDPLPVNLLPISPFKSVAANPRFKILAFTWPEGDEALAGECIILGERRPSYAVAEGLYLSRVCFTEPADDAEELTRGKAIALTNTSSRAIALDGSVTFTATRPRREDEIAAGKTEPVVSTWDFSVKNEAGEKEFPCSVPAGGDLVFISGRWPVTDLREGAVVISTTALNNLTEEYTLSLSRNGTVCNTLKPEINAVVRLQENTLTETETLAVTSATEPLDALYAPWGDLTETVTLATIPLIAASGNSAQFPYASYLTDTADLQSVRAHCYLLDGYARSAETVVDLYAAPGYILRLR